MSLSFTGDFCKRPSFVTSPLGHLRHSRESSWLSYWLSRDPSLRSRRFLPAFRVFSSFYVPPLPRLRETHEFSSNSAGRIFHGSETGSRFIEYDDPFRVLTCCRAYVCFYIIAFGKIILINHAFIPDDDEIISKLLKWRER